MADLISGLGRHSAQDCVPAEDSEKIQLQLIFSCRGKGVEGHMHPGHATTEEEKPRTED